MKRHPTRRARPVDRLLPLAPGLLVAAFSFEAGGFFPRATAAGVVALVVLLVLHVTLAKRPFAGLSLAFLIGAVALEPGRDVPIDVKCGGACVRWGRPRR